ncbi:UDP-forming cellulose synthase catalytic subunit [Leptolyngbya sp. FACHB-261]|uniref:UDP-forming cellulose synthase catalytic subunit n=1 Tax=Leptolyngbya sp. FACHB-261 TaxID=2692806 RepID=UPI00168926F0|nr:UDP-forming cellulose synthase catalytic subunit [Leptolyngbya sp. FACHB-261]MBD2101702.1 UDP-forming cellulose synthase catalytic subunit [Leptolyngbya sp. FACHB-261]
MVKRVEGSVVETDATAALPERREGTFNRFPFNRLSQGQVVLLLLVLTLLNIPLIVASVEVWQQGLIGLGLTLLGLVLGRWDRLRGLLVWLSLLVTFRYLYYRTAYTLNLDSGWLNAVSSVLLYGAELYAVLTLVLGYFQTTCLLERQPVPLPKDPKALPWVDVYIPTYNEDVTIVRETALGATRIDYAHKQVYILDDGRPDRYPVGDSRRLLAQQRRELLRAMCSELGCTLLTRGDNDHAKAGNINQALTRTTGELILILDCDHIPVRNILKETVGFFRDRLVFMVQTPHWFYNPDPFERNLIAAGQVPPANELFYKTIQRGNDFWNAAFFCGSAAVVRRDLLLEVGGIAVETVTEDCHTSLRLHSRGYKSVYYGKTLIAGLAPDSFAALIGQQVRWARGMAQILRLENPLFKEGLSLPQRLCYFGATFHFFYGLPRLVYALAPVVFLLFAINPVKGLGLETAAFAVPHLLLSSFANFSAYKKVRFSFWSEVYEFALSFYTAWATTLALLNPKAGSFNVTDKGRSIQERVFDWRSARPLLAVTGLLLLSVLAIPVWLLFEPEAWQAVLLNAIWCFYNLVLVVCALLVSLEQPQLRRSHRLDRQLNVLVHGSGTSWIGRTLNISKRGALVQLEGWQVLPPQVELEIFGDYDACVSLNATVVRVEPQADDKTYVSFDFAPYLMQQQRDQLSLVLFSDVRQWSSQDHHNLDRPLRSLWMIASTLVRTVRNPQPARSRRLRLQIAAVAQLDWGDGTTSLTKLTAIDLAGVRLEVSAEIAQQLELRSRTRPVLNLSIQRSADTPELDRFIVSVPVRQFHPPGPTGASRSNKLRETTKVELEFPVQLQPQQESRLQAVLYQLDQNYRPQVVQ